MTHGIWKYFKRSDFVCRCGCGFDSLDVELADIILEMRETLNDPMFINSGCRCESHNQTVGGAPKSYHMQAKAVDIRAKQLKPAALAAWIDRAYPHKYGVIIYNGRIHLDVRPIRYRGDKT